MFSVDLKEDQISAGLARAVAELGDLRPLMQDIGAILVDSTKQRFKAGTSPDGVTWAAKSPATLAAYAARKPPLVAPRPLFGASQMLSSLISAEPDRNQVAVGSSRFYAAMMQFGGTRAAYPHLWGDIPARPFLGISDQDRINITGQIEDWLSGLFK